MNPSSDRVALELISQRRPEGMEMLYDRYGRLAYSLAYRVLGDREGSEDVVQDAFLSVWQRAVTYDASRGPLRGWLCAVVRNRALDRLKGRSGRARTDVPLDFTPRDHAVGDVWGEVSAALERERIRSALGALSPDHRQTLELAYYGGYSQREISQAMSVPLGTVKGRTRGALHKLRTMLEGEGLTEGCA